MVMNAAAMWINSTFANFDLAITLFIHQLYDIAGDFFTPFFEFISFLGHDGIPLIIFSFILILFKKTRKFGTAMLLGLAIGAIITNCCLKILIARARPYADESSIYYQLWKLVGQNTESDKSFPSGHTTAAFAFSCAIYLVGNRKVSWTAFIFGILMAVARIYLVVHYPSDVVAGIIVGLFGGITGTLIATKIPRKFYQGYGFEKFYCVDKTIIKDEEHISDFESSEKIGRVRCGNLGLYYTDLGKDYFTDYSYIDKTYVQVNECAEDEFSQTHSYFKLILEHAGKQFASLIYEKEKDVKDALDAIKAKLN